ncbi:MAG: DUF1365 domain-containing protein [Bdellovibrionaceae bacterium]|nr:DUF1365 domain-containing protein [Pseudobdellovibrionaceae bacterium]NUM60376.1 DUF1365 domain-containing protein [Pseudobdellovibrionaceae bacterium]
MNKWLYWGKTWHKRFSPKIYEFSFSSFYLKFPLSRMNELENFIFSINKWNIFSFYTKDHGYRDGSDLWIWVEDKLKIHQFLNPIDRVDLQTFPRVLGYVFNPVSFWFCYEQEQLKVILVEVNNTFGETHTYLVSPTKKNITKEFHVSPFFKITGDYNFDFSFNEKVERVQINYKKNDISLLTAFIEGYGIEFSSKNLFKTFFKFPFYTFLVIFGIHYHALRLWLKKIPFYGKKGIYE